MPEHNPSTLIFLVDETETVRAIELEYEPEGNRTLAKTLDSDIVKDQFVVVQTKTRHEMTVAKVTAVDCEIDLESGVWVPWIVHGVDTSALENSLAEEKAMQATVEAAMKRKKKAELRAALFADNDEGIQSLRLAGESGGVLDRPKE